MSATLLALEQKIAKDGYGYVAITPSAAGTTLTVIANGIASELDPDDTEKLFGSAWLKCISDSAATPLNVGEVRRIDSTSGYTPSSGTITVTRAFSNATTTTQRFGIFMGLSPEDYGLARGLKSYINDVLRRLWQRRPFVLTLVTDGDMETSGVTNWTATNSTRTKSTSTGVTLGKQALRVQNTALNGYVQSATINVEPSQSYYLVADVTVASGTAVLELWDVTDGVVQRTASAGAVAFDNVAKTITDTGNGLAIFNTGDIVYTNASNNPGPFTVTTGGVAGTITCTGATFVTETPAGAITITKGPAIDTSTCAERQSRRLWLQTTSLPSGCRQVAVRLGGQQATADVYWDNVQLRNTLATEMSLPSWFKDARWLERIYISSAGNASSAGIDKSIDTLNRYEANWWGVHEDREGVTPFKVQFDIQSYSGGLLMGEALCPFTELSADTDSTEADADWVASWSLALIGQDKEDERLVKRWLPEAKRLDRQFQPMWSGRRYQQRSPYT